IQMTDELHIHLRRDDLAYYGVSRKYVAQFLQTALQGEPVSLVLDGQRRFDLVIRLEEAYRTNYAQLGRLRIDLPPDRDGKPRGQVELRELADIGTGIGPNAVNRENARRRIVIRCNTHDRDLASVVADIQPRIGGEAFSQQMILRGSLERLAPVLMTALTAGIALIPLVIGGNEPGREILYPVATVILGGLITSTFCEFLIRPGLFWRFSGGDAERLAQEECDETQELAATTV